MLEGELEVLVEGESHVLKPGGIAHVPAGVTHGYRNVTDAHFLTIVTRGNATEFFTEVSPRRRDEPAGHRRHRPRGGRATTSSSL